MLDRHNFIVGSLVPHLSEIRLLSKIQACTTARSNLSLDGTMGCI